MISQELSSLRLSTRYTHCQPQKNVEGRHEQVWSPLHDVDGVVSDHCFAMEAGADDATSPSVFSWTKAISMARLLVT